MTNPKAESSPSSRARLLATLNLTVVTAGIIAQAVIADRLVVTDDAAGTAAAIVDNTSLYRLGFTIFMIEMIAQILASLVSYDLLKPVNRSVARAMMVLGLTGGGIKTMARVFYYAPLILLGGASYLSAVPPAQLEALSLAFIRINHQAAGIALIFFGVETVLRGWLIFRSAFLPRFLGVLSMIGGIGWFTYVWPPLGSQLFVPIVLFALAGVITTSGWLLIRGIDDATWRERAAQAATSIWR